MNTNLIAVIITIVGAVWASLRAHNKHMQKIDGAIQQWAPIVFDAVNDMVERNKNTTYSNKSGLFLDMLANVLGGEGIKMTPQISAKAVAIADALHHQEKEFKKSQGILFPPGEVLTTEGK